MSLKLFALEDTTFWKRLNIVGERLHHLRFVFLIAESIEELIKMLENVNRPFAKNRSWIYQIRYMAKTEEDGVEVTKIGDNQVQSIYSGVHLGQNLDTIV